MLHRQHIAFDQAAGAILDGDLLAFRPKYLDVGGRLTAVAGRGDYCHAAIACWWGSTLMVLESCRAGVRAVSLAEKVRQFPGLIDVYELQLKQFPRFDHRQFVEALRRKTGRHYGVWALLRTALTHAFIVRLWIRPSLVDRDDADSRGPEFCSQAIASAARLAGSVDAVGDLADCNTEPCDLARSALFNFNDQGYRFTLQP